MKQRNLIFPILPALILYMPFLGNLDKAWPGKHECLCLDEMAFCKSNRVFGRWPAWVKSFFVTRDAYLQHFIKKFRPFHLYEI